MACMLSPMLPSVFPSCTIVSGLRYSNCSCCQLSPEPVREELSVRGIYVYVMLVSLLSMLRLLQNRGALPVAVLGPSTREGVEACRPAGPATTWIRSASSWWQHTAPSHMVTLVR